MLSTSFGTAGPGSGQFSENKGIAVDQSDGSVYVVDSGNFRVQKFDAAGNFVLAFGKGVNQTNPGDVCTAVSGDTCQAGTQGSGGSGFDTNGGFSNPTFVAIDPVNSDVYVADSGAKVVDKFSSSGAFLSSNDGSGSGAAFGALAGIAVDSSRNLWVYDEGAQMREFDSAGAFLTQWNSGYGVARAGIAVDSSQNLYVIRGFPIVEKFSSAGTDLGGADASGTATSVAIDPATDDLYVGAGSKVNRFAGGCVTPCEAVESFGAADIANAAGVAVRGSSATAYVSDPGKPAVEVFNFVTLPGGVTTGNADAVTATTATLHGTVNPDGAQLTDCHFEYGTTTAYGLSAPCVPAAASIPPDSSEHAVSAEISGLTPGTPSYHYRLSAAVEGTVTGADRTFSTPDSPLIGIQSVEDVSFSDATLSAMINPRGAKTTYHVEYGTTASYGQSTPESLPIGFEGDFSDHTVSVHIGSLAPATAYHFRFVATNSAGTDEGSDTTFATFTTPPVFGPCSNDRLRPGFGGRLPNCRAYELATPIDKHGANVQGTNDAIQAASTGDRVTFYLTGGLPGTGGSASLAAFMASRGPAGWSSASLLPATEPGASAEVMGWSEDLSIAAVSAPGPGNVGEGVYLRDSGSGDFQLGATAKFVSDGSVAGFAADTSHLIFESQYGSEGLPALLPEAAVGKDNLYELDHGTLTLAGRIPAASATSCDDAAGPACVPAPEGSFAGPYRWTVSDTSSGGARARYYTENTISRDGSRVFFTAGGSGQLYVREDGIRTTQVSASQAAVPDPNGPRPAAFMAATPDGSKVFFTSCEKLTDDSTAVSNGENSCATYDEHTSGYFQGRDLYSYDVDSGELTDLSVDSNASDPKGAAVEGVLGTSADGSYVYFAARGVLAPGASPANCFPFKPATCNLYVSHEGAVDFIASLDTRVQRDSSNWSPQLRTNSDGEPKTSRVAADGRTLLFSSTHSLTGYNNTPVAEGACGIEEPCRELFRYSAPDEELICVSCNPTAIPPSGDSDLGSVRSFLHSDPHIAFLTRNLSAGGNRVFFDSSDDLLPTDINGVRDVYEWEAEGSGSCESGSQNGGCLYLISSGTSPDPSYFGDASTNGDDAFFFTSQQLVPSDGDQLTDIYDARVGGGLPSQHPLSPPTCDSTACQANPAPPPEQTPASAAFSGPGNVHEPTKARGCPKGKRKVRHAGKVRCQKARKQHKRHNNRGGSK